MSSLQESWPTGCKVLRLFYIYISMCRYTLNGISCPCNDLCPASCHFTGTGVTAYSLHPGVIRTELGRHFWPTVPLWKRVLYVPFVFFIKNPTEGAQTTIYCAVEESLQNESGLYYRSVCVIQQMGSLLIDSQKGYCSARPCGGNGSY